ncbi:MAG: nuclease-related domain-containing protein [Clostridia bacterium]
MIYALIIIGIIFVGIRSWLFTPKGKGFLGELKVKIIIGKTKSGKKFIINNYMVVDEGKSSQIDHILINENGVFIIETKNYSGRIYGDYRQLEWTQVLAYGKAKYKM